MTRPTPVTRVPRFPSLRNGTTFHHITDTHFGTMQQDPLLQHWHNRLADDLSDLKIYNNGGHVHTGDMIHYQDSTVRGGQDAAYVAWRDSIKAADGLPFAEAVGNHDLGGFQDYSERTAAQWASAVGIASQNMVHDMGDIRVITIGPDTWGYTAGSRNDFILSTATTDWLNTQLQATSKPCFIAAHVPLEEQFLSNPGSGKSRANYGSNNPALDTVLADNANAIGWLSGHMHILPSNSYDHARMVPVGGRNMFVLNGPAAGEWSGNDLTVHKTEALVLSMFITLLDENTLDVRWRNHNGKTWHTLVGSYLGQTYRRINR